MKAVRRRWTQPEREHLVQYYQSTAPEVFDIKELSRQMGRTPKSIVCMAIALGITNPNRQKSVAAKLQYSQRKKEHHAAHGPFHFGLGLKRSAEQKLKISEVMRRQWADPQSTFNTEEYKQMISDRFAGQRRQDGPSRSLACKRPDLDNRFFRSRWEANYARYLNWLKARGEILGWEYEADTFWFHEIKRGVRSYLPDFKINNKDGSVIYHEVKGYNDAVSKTKLKRMAIYYPEIKIELIDSARYKSIERAMRKIIPGWEFCESIKQKNHW